MAIVHFDEPNSTSFMSNAGTMKGVSSRITGNVFFSQTKWIVSRMGLRNFL